MNFKKILLAVDASENAMRAVEYVGHIAAGCDGFEVQIHCIERLPHRDIYPDETAWKDGCQATRAELTQFMETARQNLVQRGVPQDKVTDRYVISCQSPFKDMKPACSRGTGVAQEILAEVESGGFGTVVVGRRGVSKEEEFIFGSVSNKIVHSAKNCTVWVVS
ncbi:universal stress protein [uncultured Pseudodesulfovibrio sp.]|uniref:universal stress protein n=1 Tax=uncultured Pseudodesulfovibrio sp. TaxID=2035858 RepID=UPI0029C6D399|nr:universal stress protein [uncultured Pseudodesulfovibrio sp.]